MTYEFCEKKKDKRWLFTKDNYPSFKQEMGKPWVESLLKNLPSLSFHNPIEEESALNEPDDLEVDAWEKKYVFVSNEDLEYIKKHSPNLRELQFYNVPSLKTYLDSPFPCVDSLTSFCFDYDTNIFDGSIDSRTLEGCSQFTNLQYISIHSGIFNGEEAITDFFSPFAKLKNLDIYYVEPDNDEEGRSTDLFKGLTCLKSLTFLHIGFIQEPDFLPLANLSSLNSLANLSIEFDSPFDERTIIKTNVLLKLLNYFLPNLENLTIDNGWLYRHKVDESKLFPVNGSFWKDYPKLQSIKGNMIFSKNTTFTVLSRLLLTN
jgi:hypothetical protein